MACIYANPGPNRQLAFFKTVTSGKSKVGEGVIVGVSVIVGVRVIVGVYVSVGVVVDVWVAVEVSVGVGGGEGVAVGFGVCVGVDSTWDVQAAAKERRRQIRNIK